MEFRKDILTNEEIIVRCPTEEQAILLTTWAHENGKEWRLGGSYINDHRWDEYRERTYYRISKGSISYYERCDEDTNIVLTFEEAALKPENKTLTFKEKMLLKKKQSAIKKLKESITAAGYNFKESEDGILSIEASPGVFLKLTIEEVV